jgi:hypothetical protein
MSHYNFYRFALSAVLSLTVTGLAAAAPAGEAAPADAITLYNQGAAVVSTTRRVDLRKGAQTIDWPLSGRLRPGTFWLAGEGVHLTGLSVPARNSDLLTARVGRPVMLLRGGPGRTQTRAATLVGVHGANVLVRLDGRIERLTADSPWRIAWPAGGAASGARLNITASKAGPQPLTAIYQIDGPHWQAAYTGRFDPETHNLSLQSMAVIDNSGGSRLHARHAWLIAGDIARAKNGPRPVALARRQASFAAAPVAAGGTYRYALAGGFAVASGARRAIALRPKRSFAAQRHFRFESNFNRTERNGARRHAEIRLNFVNNTEAPLPAGVVRVYSAPRTAHLLGEDVIGDIPKGAPVTLTLARAFDITGARQIVAEHQGHSGRHKRGLEITLYNAGDDPAAVRVIEHLPAAAEIVSATPKVLTRNGTDTAVWRLDVPAGGQASLHYTVTWPTNQ